MIFYINVYKLHFYVASTNIYLTAKKRKKTWTCSVSLAKKRVLCSGKMEKICSDTKKH